MFGNSLYHDQFMLLTKQDSETLIMAEGGVSRNFKATGSFSGPIEASYMEFRRKKLITNLRILKKIKMSFKKPINHHPRLEVNQPQIARRDMSSISTLCADCGHVLSVRS